MRTKKILFVAMQNSIHVARYLRQLTHSNSPFEVHLFCVTPYKEHEEIDNVILHKPAIFFNSISRKTPKKNEIKYVYPLIMPEILLHFFNKIMNKLTLSIFKPFTFFGPWTLKKVIKKLNPQIIQSLEFQTCGYLVLETLKKMPQYSGKWIATNWGSDIFYFINDDKHKVYITELLARIDYYQCECKRDVKLAKELGFNKKVLPVMPNTGGFNIAEIAMLRSRIKPGERKLIMLKGYQSFAGRALTTLKVIEKLHAQLSDYTIAVYSASLSVKLKVTELQKQIPNVNFLLIPQLPHNEMLNLFATARIYLGISVSDGISTSLLEAMALGAFPIQTNTACCEEWIVDGKSGFIVPHDNVDVIANALVAALNNDKLVDSAAEYNFTVIKQKLNADDLREKILNVYKEIIK